MSSRRVLHALSVLLIVAAVAGCGGAHAKSHVGGGGDHGNGGVREPVGATMFADIDGRHLFQWRQCGGTLTTTENRTRVAVHFTAPVLFPGEGSCAITKVSATLKSPLARRALVDGYNGARVQVLALDHVPAPALAVLVGPPTFVVPIGGPGPAQSGCVIGSPADDCPPHAVMTYRILKSSATFVIVETAGTAPMAYGASWQAYSSPTRVNGKKARLRMRVNDRSAGALEWSEDGVTIAVAATAGTRPKITVSRLHALADSIRDTGTA